MSQFTQQAGVSGSEATAIPPWNSRDLSQEAGFPAVAVALSSIFSQSAIYRGLSRQKRQAGTGILPADVRRLAFYQQSWRMEQMKLLGKIVGAASAALSLAGCVTSTIDAWTISDVSLVSGLGSANDAPSCKNVDKMRGPAAIPEGTDDFTGLIMWQYSDTRPSQPLGGDWMESSSDYTGYLFNQSGSDEYRCATARVTVQRNPDVAPNVVFEEGQFIQLYVVAPHLCNEPNAQKHPDEDARQALSYAQEIAQTNQSVVVFEQVIVASTCGGGVYTDNFAEGFEVNFGRWPSPDTSGTLTKQGQTNSIDCTFLIGQNNFQGCP